MEDERKINEIFIRTENYSTLLPSDSHTHIARERERVRETKNIPYPRPSAHSPIQNVMFNACELKKEIAGERLTELRFFLSILLQPVLLFFCLCTGFSVLFAVQ